MKLDLDIRIDRNGRKILYFPFMSISDTHLGTKYSRAKKLSHMLQHTQTGRLFLTGDIIDGTALKKKAKWNWGAWHRQVMGHFLRKAAAGTSVTFIDGNHEEGMRDGQTEENGVRKSYRDLSGKRIYNIDFAHTDEHTDPRGRRMLIIHGDQYDDHIFKHSKHRQTWYRIGDTLYTGLCETDALLKNTSLLEHFSLAASGKKAVKTLINRFMGVRKAMANAVDDSEFDGAVYGHSHMGGFERTGNGKLLMNDGCCTEHVQALVHDSHGNWALIEWHKDRGGPTSLDRWAAYLRWNPVSAIMPPLRNFLLHFHILSVKPDFGCRPLPVS